MFEAAFRYDHSTILGDTYRSPVIRLTQPPPAPGVAGDPYDLTGVTGEVVVLSEVGGRVLLEPTWALVDATDGTFRWSADHADVEAALVPGDFRYAVRLTWSDASRDTILTGTLTVLPALVR